jgi:hypothetical protein
VTRDRLLLAAVLVLAAGEAHAQRMPDINAPTRAARRAVAAEDARLSAQTGQAVPSPSGPPAPAPTPPPPSAAPAAPAATVRPSKRAPAPAPAARGKTVEPVTRELFTYQADGRRDPFFSLILTDDLRPLLSDLRLVGVLYEASGSRSIAIFRDVLTNAQYRVGTGMALGRMRVAQIKQRGVIFTIDEFGLSRQDSLMLLSDSTRVRMR